MALDLLDKEGENGYVFEDFEKLWKAKLPLSEFPDLKQLLQGNVLYWSQGLNERVKSFKLSSLPTTSQERFAALFKERVHWSLEDITPYITDLLAIKQSVGALLMKHTRKVVGIGGEPLYCKR